MSIASETLFMHFWRHAEYNSATCMHSFYLSLYKLLFISKFITKFIFNK